jgi:hypothetical protein
MRYLLFSVVLLAACKPKVEVAPDPVRQSINAATQLQEVLFRDVIASATGHEVLKADVESETIAMLGTVLDETLQVFNLPDSPTSGLRRINEASRFFEDSLLARIDALPNFRCESPPTADGKSQRSGYPDLKIVHEPSGAIFYLDPKLFETGSEKSSLRTFYFEPKGETNKVLDDAVHLLVGIAHDGNDGKWQFLHWHLVDLYDFKVRLKAEFQSNNKELYREELLLKRSF